MAVRKPAARYLATVLLVFALSFSVRAEPASTPVQVTPAQDSAAKAYHLIFLKHMPADFMAWWIDAEHNAMPQAMAKAREVWGVGSDKSEPKRTSIFSLPAGIDSLAAVVPQRALLAYGTEKGLEQLKTLINYLDKPQQSVEISAQIVFLNNIDARVFGIDFQPSLSSTPSGKQDPVTTQAVTMGYVRNNFQSTLQQLIQKRRARIVAAPRLVIPNNLSGSTFITNTELVTLVMRSAAGEFKAPYNTFIDPKNTPVNLASTLKLAFMPTINNDDTITLACRLSKVLSLTDHGTKTPQEFSIPVDLQAIANVKDKDTIAFGNLTPQLIDVAGTAEVKEKSGPPFNQHLIFVTARIIRPSADQQ